MAQLWATIRNLRGTGRLDGDEFAGVHTRTLPDNTPNAILVRAIGPVTGLGQGDGRHSSPTSLVEL